MPKLSSRQPKYLKAQRRDMAFYWLNGKRVYLPGKFKSPESIAAYNTAMSDLSALKAGCLSGVTNTKRSVMGKASMPVTRTVMVTTKFTSTRWKVCGRYCEVGFALTVGFRRNACPPTSDFSNLSTMPADAETHCSEP